MKNSYKLNIFSKNITSKFILISAFTLSAFFIPASCYSNTSNNQDISLKNIVDADGSLNRVSKSGVLRIGADPNTGLPFIKRQNFGLTYKGFEFDISKYLADQLGCKVKIIPTNWDNLLSGLENKKYDIVLNTLEKPEDNKQLSKNIGFSKSYYANSQKIVISKNSKKIRYLIDLKGKKVGVLNDSIAKVMIAELNKIKHAGITMVMYTNNQDLFNSLQKKLIDGILTTNSIGAVSCQDENNNCKQVGISIFPKNYVIAVRKEDRALLNGIDSIIGEGKKNNSINKILNKWNLQ
ncbi:MAG: amino acid ABC transporter substrate-binding protein [Candidatus Sericytochromatia bacterium]|nr:amino acid ABC transporter substrate-binding protein [Candidatus Sericytochromatia bacterium]